MKTNATISKCCVRVWHARFVRSKWMVVVLGERYRIKLMVRVRRKCVVGKKVMPVMWRYADNDGVAMQRTRAGRRHEGTSTRTWMRLCQQYKESAKRTELQKTIWHICNNFSWETNGGVMVARIAGTINFSSVEHHSLKVERCFWRQSLLDKWRIMGNESVGGFYVCEWYVWLPFPYSILALEGPSRGELFLLCSFDFSLCEFINQHSECIQRILLLLLKIS